jgi:hypothetical protein
MDEQPTGKRGSEPPDHRPWEKRPKQLAYKSDYFLFDLIFT